MSRSVLFVAIALLLLFTAIWLRPENPADILSRTRIMMGTVVEISIPGSGPGEHDEVIERAFAAMDQVEELMSPHREQSEVSQLSRSSAPLAVSADTAAVIRMGQEMAVASGGAFDMAVGRLVRLWGFASDEPGIPDVVDIRPAMTGLGSNSISIDGNLVTKADPEIVVELGGIAKGFAVDRAAGILRDAGVGRASINAGGDMVVIGNRGDRPWRVGIQHPRKPDRVLAVARLTDAAIVTSGDYERYFERAGQRYHHILDPRTGRPATACRAVTVIGRSAARADALATALFVLGPEKGLELAGQTGVEAMLVDADGEIHTTAGFREMVTWPEEE